MKKLKLIIKCLSLPDSALDEAIDAFMDNQQPLGKEFQDILDENRWELYERSD